MRAQRTQQQREAVGVELYGYQQTLAKLQMALEKAQESYAESNATRCGHACVCTHACLLASCICDRIPVLLTLRTHRLLHASTRAEAIPRLPHVKLAGSRWRQIWCRRAPRTRPRQRRRARRPQQPRSTSGSLTAWGRRSSRWRSTMRRCAAGWARVGACDSFCSLSSQGKAPNSCKLLLRVHGVYMAEAKR